MNAQQKGVYKLVLCISMLLNTGYVFAKKSPVTIISGNPYSTLKSVYSTNNNVPCKKKLADAPNTDNFSWEKNRKLSWNDFQGHKPVNTDHHTAAATYCSIGFETKVAANGKPIIYVYNSFYPSSSWVLENTHDDEILIHEQGHFDICELYTRRLKECISMTRITGKDITVILEDIYNKVNLEYQSFQQAYESETEHGLNDKLQLEWNVKITSKLNATARWAN